MPRETQLSDATIVIPVLNQLSYTANCLQFLNRAGILDSQIVVVNNASTDGTADFLAARQQIHVIHNAENRSCGFAFNQGIRQLPATWTVLLNNDVAFHPGTMKQLIAFAETESFDLASPAMCEGDLDYDLTAYSDAFVRRMSSVKRLGIFFGPCFMVHRRVFETLGLFDDDPRLGGYEDDEFWRRCRRAGFRMAITGQSLIHHFGSVTQKSIKASRHQPHAILGDRNYYRKKTGQTWVRRKVTQIKQAIQKTWWTKTERLLLGDTLLKTREGGAWLYR
jgi:GT2 family glycosyltransferase